MNNKEIELKFIISEEIKKNIIADLQKICDYHKTTRQIDTYYIPYYKNFEINGVTLECLRIRETEGDCILGYKKIHRESSPVYCDEYETKISNKEQAEKILLSIGFSVQMIIDKTRITYRTEDLEFDFDSVKDLKELLEIELLDNSKDINEIYNFVSKYGLTKKDVTYKGIQKMVMEANKK